MNPWLILIIAFLSLDFLLELVSESLNLSRLSANLPKEFKAVYNVRRYAESQRYTRELTVFSLLRSSLMFGLTLAFLLAGGFNVLDRFARGFGWPMIPTGLVFTGGLMLILFTLDIPWSAWRTFRIEARYGFNKMTVRTFVLDKVKTVLLAVVIGGLLLTAVFWFFQEATGSAAWLWTWVFFMVFQVIALFLAPLVIMPLFNKFIPLPGGPLKNAIQAYCRKQEFRLKGVFTMDASKRSTKTNAFFTGLGKSRRIVLFDTLVKKMTPAEIVAVLAHETGHYKKRHLLRMLLLSALESFLLFLFLSLVINNQGLFAAFRMEQTSIYASLVLFGFLFTPVSLVLKFASNWLSRKNEREADRFAARTTGKPGNLVSALKKLSVDNLSNLTPHPMKVMLEYSHPPVLERIRRLSRLKQEKKD